jgi:hypothetical protein
MRLVSYDREVSEVPFYNYIVFAIFGFVIVALVVFAYRIQRAKQLAELCARAEAGESEAETYLLTTDVGRLRKVAKGGGREVSAGIYRLLEDLKAYHKKHEEMAERLAAFRDAGVILERVKAATSLATGLYSLPPLAKQRILTELRIGEEDIARRTKEELERALTGLSTDGAVERIQELIAVRRHLQLWRSLPSDWGFITQTRLYPSNWNELVAHTVVNPQWGDFVLSENDEKFEKNEMRLRAARAIRRANLTEAKLILAVYSDKPEVMSEVESEQRTELAYLIESHPTQQALLPNQAAVV